MARVPYTGVPDTQAAGIPQDRLGVQANPAETGGLLAQAERQAGAEIGQGAGELSQTAIQLKQIANNTATLNATTAFSKELGALDTDFFQKRGSDTGVAFPAYQKAVDDLQQKYAGQFTGLAQQRFLQDAKSYADRSLFTAGHYVADQTVQANIGAVKGAIAEEQSRATRDVMLTGAMPNFDRLVELNRHLGGINGWSDDEVNANIQASASSAVHNAIITRVAHGDVGGANRILESAAAQNAPGTDLPLLDGKAQADLSMLMLQKQNIAASTALTQQMRQMAYAEKVQKEAAEKSGNAIVEQIIKDPTKIDPNIIANDPALSFDQKIHLNDVLQQQLTKPKGDLLAQSYGVGFVPALNRVMAAEGDPTRITDPTQLWQIAAQDRNLSPSGIAALTGIIEGKRTPDGEAASQIQKSVMDYAKQQLSFEMQIGNFNLKDPKGQQAYEIGFVPAFLKYWDSGLRAGKTPFELADKASIDKVIQPFQRSAAERARDMVNAQADVPAGPGEGGQAFDLNTQAGIVGAYRAGKISREDAAQKLIQGGFAAPAAPAPPMAMH